MELSSGSEAKLDMLLAKLLERLIRQPMMMLAIPAASVFDERLSDSRHCLHTSGTSAVWHACLINPFPAASAGFRVGRKKRGEERVRRKRSIGEAMDER